MQQAVPSHIGLMLILLNDPLNNKYGDIKNSFAKETEMDESFQLSLLIFEWHLTTFVLPLLPFRVLINNDNSNICVYIAMSIMIRCGSKTVKLWDRI